MTTLTSPFVWLGLLSIVVGVVLAAVVWRQRESPGSRIYAVLMAVLAGWSALYVLQLLQPTVSGKQPWLIARHAITPLVAVLFWLFAAKYTDRNELTTARYLVPIVGVGSVLTVLVLLNPGELYWADLSLYTAGSIPRVDIQFGPAFWLMVLYIGAVVGGGHVYFVLMLLDSFSVYRRQLGAMAVVGTIEFVLLAVFLTEHTMLVPDLNPWPHLQLITYNMVFVAVPLGWSYFRASLFSVQLLDRQTVIEGMEDAVFVFDTNNKLRRVNEQGLALLDSESPSEGVPAAAVFADRQLLLKAYRGELSTADDSSQLDNDFETDDGVGDAVELTVDGEMRWYSIRVSEIENSAGDRTGTVLVARDITVRRENREMLVDRTAELKEKTEVLERQNERLDKFAGIVSHDLRNPLNVAQLRFELLQDDIPEEHAEVVQRNLDRMEKMIEQLLAMARAETTAGSTEPLFITPLVDDAWQAIQPADATLESTLDCDLTVEGDRDLLLNVFENLFRNAVEHGSTNSQQQAGDAVEHGSTNSRSATDDAVEHGSTSNQTRTDAAESGSPDDRSDDSAPLQIRVGSLDAERGFFVEDTGRGIPETQREELFEFGHTTASGGTGFGLAIVRELVEAHGWEISVTNGKDGGARFEILTE